MDEAKAAILNLRALIAELIASRVLPKDGIARIMERANPNSDTEPRRLSKRGEHRTRQKIGNETQSEAVRQQASNANDNREGGGQGDALVDCVDAHVN